METKTALEQIMLEVNQSMEKYPTWPNDPIHALAVLGEEFGELTKDVLQMGHLKPKAVKNAQ